MGYGSYSYEAHRALASARVSKPAQRVFRQRECHPLMDPFGVRHRESRDSPQHPDSLGVVFALDVTGSMGAIAQRLAKQELPEFMSLLGELGLRDAQVAFMAVGDAVVDQAPLQVGQFESTAELMDQWLTWTWLEGGGGGGDYESYELALHFAARHIDMDCYRKRERRGYLFLTGDEKPYPRLSRHIVKQVLDVELDRDLPLGVVVEEVQRAFEPFFLIPGLDRRVGCEREWRDVLGDRVVCMEDPDDTAIVAASLVALTERLLDLDGVVAKLKQRGTERRRIGGIARALMPFAATLDADGAPRPHLDLTATL